MPIEATVLSVVAHCAMAAWELYKIGFSKVKQAPLLYIEFGVAIRGLGQNLDSIKKIIQNAERQLHERRLREFGSDPFELEAFNQIVGNYKITLGECKTLLEDNKKYRRDRGFIRNVTWNLDVDPKVVRLRDRVAFHNVKIIMIMQTLEIKIISDLEELILQLHQDQAERFTQLQQDHAERFTQIDKKLDRILGEPTQSSERETLEPSSLEIPSELSERFQNAVFTNAQEMTKFPLQDGLDAFFQYFKERLVALEMTSYLDLMKCVWIMDRLVACDEFKNVKPGSLYDRTVREMKRRLRRELDRIEKERIPSPDLAAVLHLSEKDFQIWAVDPKVDKPDEGLLEVLLDLSLPTGGDSEEHTLRVLRNPDGTLQIEDKTVTTTRTVAGILVDRDRMHFDFELAKARLIPLYMHPSSISDALSLKFRGGDGSSGITPTFRNINDLLQFQHLITGYQAVGIRESVIATYLGRAATDTEGKGKGKQKEEKLEESGKLQIWKKAPFGKSMGTIYSETSSSIANNPRSHHLSSDSLGRRISVAATSSSSFLSQGRTPSQAVSEAASSTQTRQVSIGDSAVAIESDIPEPPLLVLFLERKVRTTGTTLLFLVITMNKDTNIDPSACDCRKTSDCHAVVIKKSGGPLTAHCFSTAKANDWNLAAVGAFWKHNDKIIEIKLPWLRIDFLNSDERRKFADRFRDYKDIFGFEMQDYYKFMNGVKSTNIVTLKRT